MKGGDTRKTLKEIPCGQTAKAVKGQGKEAVKRRMMDMGITKGFAVTVQKEASPGDPVEITVCG